MSKKEKVHSAISCSPQPFCTEAHLRKVGEAAVPLPVHLTLCAPAPPLWGCPLFPLYCITGHGHEAMNIKAEWLGSDTSSADGCLLPQGAESNPNSCTWVSRGGCSDMVFQCTAGGRRERAGVSQGNLLDRSTAARAVLHKGLHCTSQGTASLEDLCLQIIIP